METNNKNCYLSLSNSMIKKEKNGYNINGENNNILYFHDGKEFKLQDNEVINGVNIKINGNNNTIIIGEQCIFSNSTILIGNNNVNIKIDKKNKVMNTKIRCCYGNDQNFIVGESNIIQGNFYLDETSSFLLGNNNFFSQEIKVWCSDGHSIIDHNTKKIINKPLLPVVIKNHCWIGYGAFITKNVQLPNNTIVGLASVVTEKFFEEYTVIAGNPAKIIKRNVTWDIRNTYYLDKHNKGGI